MNLIFRSLIWLIEFTIIVALAGELVDMTRMSGTFVPANSCVGPQLGTHVLETNLVDFEWSEAQHRIGFDFAVKNCPKHIPAAPPEVVACRIQESKSSLNPSPAHPELETR